MLSYDVTIFCLPSDARSKAPSPRKFPWRGSFYYCFKLISKIVLSNPSRYNRTSSFCIGIQVIIIQLDERYRYLCIFHDIACIWVVIYKLDMVDKSLCSFITNASYRLAVLVDCYINLSIDIFVLYIVLLAVKKCRTSIFEFIKRLEDSLSETKS